MWGKVVRPGLAGSWIDLTGVLFWMDRIGWWVLGVGGFVLYYGGATLGGS